MPRTIIHSTLKNICSQKNTFHTYILKRTRSHVNIQNQMTRFQVVLIRRVAPMSGEEFVKQSFLRSGVLTTASDHFYVVLLILKKHSGSIWCDLFTVNKYRQCMKLFWVIINPVQHSGHNQISGFTIQVAFIFQAFDLILHLLFMRSGATESYSDIEAILMTGSLHLDKL